MANVGMDRRKGLAHVVYRRVTMEPLSLPIKVMMMCDRCNAGFDDELRHGQAQRDIDGDRQNVFGHQNVELKTLVKLLQLPFQLLFEFLDTTTGLTGSAVLLKQLVLNFQNFGVSKKSFLDKM